MFQNISEKTTCFHISLKIIIFNYLISKQDIRSKTIQDEKHWPCLLLRMFRLEYGHSWPTSFRNKTVFNDILKQVVYHWYPKTRQFSVIFWDKLFLTDVLKRNVFQWHFETSHFSLDITMCCSKQRFYIKTNIS